MAECKWRYDEFCTNDKCPVCADYCPVPNDEGVCRYEERISDEKITCLNCKHLMFSDMYGECNKQLRIVKPSNTCEYAEPKEREVIIMKTLDHEQYIDFIKKTIKEEGWKVADTANKLALEQKAITTEQYSEAARLIVDAFLA